MKNIVTCVLILVSLIAIIYVFNFLSNADLTGNEQTLLNILLFIASSGLSWLISHFYYEVSNEKKISEIKEDYQKNLKTYASKAAEKVTNLSSELTRLTNYLKDSLEDGDHESVEEDLNAKRERMSSAIHIINTLRSINDGSLSDWKGIIPEEIEDIKEEERERIESIEKILGEYQDVVKVSERDVSFGLTDENLRKDIRQLNSRLDLVINSIGGVSTKHPQLKKEKVEEQCPNCDILIKYKQKPSSTSRKQMNCPHCKARLLSVWDSEVGFSVTNITKGYQGRDIGRVIDIEDTFVIDEDLIQQVCNKLPAQPWPKGTSNLVANDLGVSKEKVRKSINILIKRGVFKYQLNGLLYTLDANSVSEITHNDAGLSSS